MTCARLVVDGTQSPTLGRISTCGTPRHRLAIRSSRSQTGGPCVYFEASSIPVRLPGVIADRVLDSVSGAHHGSDGRWSGRGQQQCQLGDIHRFVPFLRSGALEYAQLRNSSADSCELLPFSGLGHLRIFIPDEEIDRSGLMSHPNGASDSRHHPLGSLAAGGPRAYPCVRGACLSCPLSEARVSARAFVHPEAVGYEALAEAVQETHESL